MRLFLMALTLAAWTPAFAGGDDDGDHDGDHEEHDGDHEESDGEHGERGEVAVQAADLPAAVTAAIAAKYPGATISKASKEGGAYEAGIMTDGKALDLAFDAAGNIVETESALALADAPAPVQATLKAKYASWTVKGMEMSVTPKGTTYEAKLISGEHRMEVAIDGTGKVVGVEKEGDREEDDRDEKH